MRDFALNGGTEISKMTPAKFRDFAREDFEKWSKLINEAGIEKN